MSTEYPDVTPDEPHALNSCFLLLLWAIAVLRYKSLQPHCTFTHDHQLPAQRRIQAPGAELAHPDIRHIMQRRTI